MNPTTTVQGVVSTSNSADDKPTSSFSRISCNDVTEFSSYEEVEHCTKDETSIVKSYDDVIMIQVDTFCPNTSRFSSYNKLDKNDAFLLYSDDEIRLDTLKSGSSSSSSVESSAEPSKKKLRKTKISFEISPLLMMTDVMLLDEINGSETREDNEYLAEQRLAQLLGL